MLYEKMDELKAQAGLGAMLFHMNASGKFSFYIPLETVPAVGSTPESIDIDVTSSDVITKIKGKMTMEDKETEFFLHRDSIRKLKKSVGKVEKFLVVNPDFTGYRFDAEVSYAQNDASSNDPLKGTMKLTPKMDGGFIDNVYDLIQRTAKFKSAIEPVVELDETTGTYKTIIETDPADATITVKSETEAVATAAIDKGALTVTGVKSGSAVIVVTATKDGYASWESTILVIVP